MMAPVLAFFAGLALGKRVGKHVAPPATSTVKPTTSTPPSSPSKVPWPSQGAPSLSAPVPQSGPRGGKEPPPAVQKKQGSEERKAHEHAIKMLQAERKQRVAELKGAGEDPTAQNALRQRIVEIDAEIDARYAAIAKLPA